MLKMRRMQTKYIHVKSWPCATLDWQVKGLQGYTDLLLKIYSDKAEDNPAHFTPLVTSFKLNALDSSITDQLASCHQTDLSAVLGLVSVTTTDLSSDITRPSSNICHVLHNFATTHGSATETKPHNNVIQSYSFWTAGNKLNELTWSHVKCVNIYCNERL